MKMSKSLKNKSVVFSLLVLTLLGAVFIVTGNLYGAGFFVSFGYLQLLEAAILLPVLFRRRLDRDFRFQTKEEPEKQPEEEGGEEVKKRPGVFTRANRRAKQIIEFTFSKKHANVVVSAFYLLALIAFAALVLNRPVTKESLNYLLLVITLLSLAISVAVEKWWFYKKTDTAFGENIAVFMFFNKIINLVFSASLIFTLLKLYDSCWLLEIIMNLLMIYFVAFFLLDIAMKLIKKAQMGDAAIYIYIPFSKNKNRGNLLRYLEENTGISMKSLWSIKYMKKILPRAVLGGALLLWLSTCIVQVQSYEQGALYRLGRLDQDAILEPGIHLKLPWPLDEVKTCDVTRVQKTIVGYENKQSENNLWTQGHGGEEYKLLSGEGKELVSINLLISYRVNDLHAYLSNFSSPVDQLNAKAYEIVMSQTINSTLDDLISRDRSQLSKTIKEQLNTYIHSVDLGVEIVEIVLESIHPPIEIADTYQNVVSAAISKQTSILNAQAQADTSLIQARTESDLAVNQAKINQKDKISKAKAEVLEYDSCIEAYHLNEQSYLLTKYLDTFVKISGNKKIYILDKDIDQSGLYLNFKNSVVTPDISDIIDDSENEG